jgi:hypothetical protein
MATGAALESGVVRQQVMFSCSKCSYYNWRFMAKDEIKGKSAVLTTGV